MKSHKDAVNPVSFLLQVIQYFALMILLLIPSSSHSLELQIHGFGSLIGAKTNSEYPIGTIENVGTRTTLDSESLLGVNLSSDLGEKMTFASQLTAGGDKDGAYKLKLIWMFATYRPAEGWAIRIGRQINPLFIYSEQLNVGFVTPWVRHPAEVYSLNPIDSFTGVSLINTTSLGDFELKTQIYGGAGSFALSSYSGSLDNDKGITLSLSSDHFNLRAAYTSSNPHLTVNTPVVLSNTALGPIYGNLVTSPYVGTIHSYSFGGSFDWRNFIGSAETMRLTSNGDLIRSSFGAYGMLGYHVLPTLTPYAIYAWNSNMVGQAYLFPDTTVSTTSKLAQHSVMFGMGYKATPSMVIKGEYMRTSEEFADVTKNFGANVFSLDMDFVF